MVRKLIGMFGIVGALFSAGLQAETVEDIQAAKVGNASLVLNGLGLNSFLREERAVGALYTESKSSDPEAIVNSTGPKRMELRIITGRLSARNFAQQWSEGISLNNSGDDWRNHAGQIVAFSKLFQQNLTTGDHVVIDYVPESGTVVSVNGTQLGKIEGKELYPLLLRTWIGARPPSEAFKTGVLGKLAEPDGKALAERFVNLQLSEARIADMKKAEDERKKAEEETKLAEEKKKKDEEERLAKEKQAKAEADQIAKLEAEKAALQKQLEAQKKAAATAPAAAAPAPSAPAPVATAASAEKSAADKLTEYRMRNTYEKQLLKAVRSKLEYPALAYRRKIEGSAILRVNINREGMVQKTVMELSSGKQILDDAALKMVQDSSPLPAIPAEISDNEFEFLVPISFKIDKK
ncbi:MAG: TonB family protein [Gammaproteobacteria bacterium]|nr:TonB family protein [Gammaproteobacteria bacterium]